MRTISALLAFAGVVTAVAPSPEDQTAMQETFRRYLRGVNECRPDLVRSARAMGEGFPGRSIGMSTLFNAALQPNDATCRLKKPSFEIAAIARAFEVAAPDAVVGSGYFRTAGLVPADKSGRVLLTFARREGRWLIFSVVFAAVPPEPPDFLAPTALGKDDPPGADGWVQLFDGQRADAFTGITKTEWPGSWKVEDGALRAIGGATVRHGLRTRDTYRDFELRWEWKAPAKGNSGVKYRIFYLAGYSAGSDATAFEYQLADDQGDPGAIGHAVERTGALYNQVAPTGAKPRPVGEWNESVLIVRGRKCEHWLNGEKVMEYETESSALESPLVLQHHGTDMWFRNIRVRRLE